MQDSPGCVPVLFVLPLLLLAHPGQARWMVSFHTPNQARPHLFRGGPWGPILFAQSLEGCYVVLLLDHHGMCDHNHGSVTIMTQSTEWNLVIRLRRSWIGDCGLSRAEYRTVPFVCSGRPVWAE
jgi:hypothetical protein